MKKKLILHFLAKYPTESFMKKSEPSAIAYEKFSKKNPDVSFAYFNRIFNEVSKSNVKKLTLENVSHVVKNYKTKHKEGFTDSEMKALLKEYSINEKKFFEVMGSYTALSIKKETVTFRHDIESAICVMLDPNNKNNFLYWD